MARYIDADKLFRYVDEQTHLSKGKLEQYIRENHTADVVEEKHGEWKEIRNAYGELEGWLCECGRESKIKENYCPNCGAKNGWRERYIMTECKWCQDEICVNADCPMRADYCPIPDIPDVCKWEERTSNTKGADICRT